MKRVCLALSLLLGASASPPAFGAGKPAPREWRILVIIAKTSSIDTLGKERAPGLPDASFSEAELELVRARHEAFEAWLGDKTRGAVSPKTDFLEIGDPVKTLTCATGCGWKENPAYWAHPKDVPDSAKRLASEGEYHSVFFWVKAPAYLPAAGDARTTSDLFLGAPFSSVIWKSRYARRARSSDGVLRREAFRQVRLRLSGLGYSVKKLPRRDPAGFTRVSRRMWRALTRPRPRKKKAD